MIPEQKRIKKKNAGKATLTVTALGLYLSQVEWHHTHFTRDLPKPKTKNKETENRNTDRN